MIFLLLFSRRKNYKVLFWSLCFHFSADVFTFMFSFFRGCFYFYVFISVFLFFRECFYFYVFNLPRMFPVGKQICQQLLVLNKSAFAERNFKQSSFKVISLYSWYTWYITYMWYIYILIYLICPNSRRCKIYHNFLTYRVFQNGDGRSNAYSHS